MHRIIGFITLIWMLYISNISNAGLYSKCIYGYNFEGGDLEIFMLYPINEECFKHCDEKCREIFSVQKDGVTEMNDDVITRCKSYCQSSKPFSSYYRDEDGSLKGPSIGPVNNLNCEVSQVWNRVYKASKLLKSGDNIVLESVDDDESSSEGNKIYGCGREIIEIKSIFKSDKTSEWPVISPWSSSGAISNDGSQTLWTDSTQHYCLNSATNRPINEIKKSKLLLGLDYTAINSNLLPSQPIPYMDSPSTPACSGSSCSILPDYRTDSDMLAWYGDSYGPCRYSARSPSVTTGLYVQNGDELSITWSGGHSAYGSTYNGATGAYGQNSSDFNKIVGLSLNEAIICARNVTINKNYTVKPEGYVSAFIPKADACETLAYEKSKLGISIGSSSVVFSGEEARVDPIFTNPSSDNKRIVSSFTGSVIDDPNVILNTNSPINCDTYLSGGSCPDSSKNCSSCFYIYGTAGTTADSPLIGKIQSSKYTYSGVLSSNPETNFDRRNRSNKLNSIPTRESLRLNMEDYTGNEDNVGGVDVSIKWGGCPKGPDSLDDRNVPDAVEYIISSCNLDPEQMYDNAGYDTADGSWISYSWSPISIDKVIGIDNIVCPNAPCCAYFRVKDPYIGQDVRGDVSLTGLTAASALSGAPLWGSKGGLRNLYGNPGNRHGYYRLSLRNAQSSFDLPKADTTGVMHNIVKFVLKKIIGTPPDYSDGALIVFYKNVISGNGYIDFVRVLLFLYIAFFGLGFMMGAIEINLKELVSRLLKVSFVIAMLSDSSWSFFATYILPAVINGPAELSAAFVMKVANSTSMANNFPSTNELGVPIETAVSTDPSLIIALMVDQPLRYIWKGLGTILPKLLAILFSSPVLGFFITFALLVSLIVYSIGLLKIVMVYMLSFLAIGFLIFIAPLAIPMVLFKFTQDVFDRWWKFLLSFAMQPIFLFAGISILNFLTIATFVASFSYTVCQSCIAYVPIIKFCLIPGYKLMETLHMPSSIGASMPAAMIISSSLFMLLSYSVYEMPSVFTAMASRLITGVSGDSNIGAAADKAYDSVNLKNAGDYQKVGQNLIKAGRQAISIGKTVKGAYMRGGSDALGALKSLMGGKDNSKDGGEGGKDKDDNTDNGPAPTNPAPTGGAVPDAQQAPPGNAGADK